SRLCQRRRRQRPRRPPRRRRRRGGHQRCNQRRTREARRAVVPGTRPAGAHRPPHRHTCQNPGGPPYATEDPVTSPATTTTAATDLAGKVAALQTQVAELTQRLDDTAPTAVTQAPPKLKFPSVEAWVHGLFLPMFGWRVDGQRWHWCPQWWRHA